jgi:hypothetical protein
MATACFGHKTHSRARAGRAGPTDCAFHFGEFFLHDLRPMNSRHGKANAKVLHCSIFYVEFDAMVFENV